MRGAHLLYLGVEPVGDGQTATDVYDAWPVPTVTFRSAGHRCPAPQWRRHKGKGGPSPSKN